MSQETYDWLRSNIRIGFTDKHGPAWWAADKSDPMADGSHFPGAVPLKVAEEILDVPLVSGPVMTKVKQPYLQTLPDGTTRKRTRTLNIRDNDRQAIVNLRTGDILGLFKSGYRIHQYQPWTLDQLAAITDQGKGHLGIRSVGLLKKAAVAFMQVQVDESFEVHGFGFVPYYLAATSCDGSLATSYSTGVQAAVCDNTLDMAIKGAYSKVKVRHSSGSIGKLQELRDRLGLVHQVADDFAEEMDRLLAVDVSEADFAAWQDEIDPMPEKLVTKTGGPGRSYTMAESRRAERSRLWTSDPKVKPWAGTAFGVLQLDNTFRTWSRGVQVAKGGRIERNFFNAAAGVTGREDVEALDALQRVQDRRHLVLAS